MDDIAVERLRKFVPLDVQNARTSFVRSVSFENLKHISPVYSMEALVRGFNTLLYTTCINGSVAT